jgi:hypothetical protein
MPNEFIARNGLISLGNVGIGITSPSVAGGGYTGLHINSSISGSSIVLSTNNTNLAYLYNLGTNGIDFAIENPGAQIFRAGSSEKMRITSAGNVGIGTAAPTAPLTVAGTTDLAWSASTSKLQISRSGTVARLQNYDNGSVASLALQWDGGNVGIGTTSPATQLHLSGSAELRMSNSANTTGFDIGLLGGNSDANAYIYQRANSNIIFGTNNTERMRITSTGNVGIGTTSFAGDELMMVSINGTTNTQAINVKDRNALANGSTFMVFRKSDDTFLGNIRRSGTSDGLFVGGNSFLALGTGGNAEHMRITSTGNVGIGTTAPQSPLHIIAASSADNALFQEWSYTSASTDIFSLMLKQTVTANVVRYNFSMVNNSTAYDNMLVFDRGNIGIGTTSPAYKLDVSKTANDSQPTFRVEGNTYEDSLVYFVNTAVGTGGTGAGGITVQYTVSANNNTDSNFINCSDAVDLRFIVWNNGGIGNFQSNDVDLSDERTKNSITNLESYWDKIKNIEIVKYKYNDQSHDDYNIGVIAQQVEEIAPEFIDNNSWKIKDTEDYYKTVYNKDLQFAAIKVLQEAMIKIEKLEQELETLKNK